MSGTGSLQASVDGRAPGTPARRKDEDESTTTAARRPWLAEGRWVWWAALAVAMAPFVASAVSVFLGVGGHYHPGGDVAAAELRVRDVGNHAVLVGPFSRDGWHHPGPALYYTLALPYRLLGGSPSAFATGALLINGLSVAGIVAVARRRGGTPLMLCMLLACALLVRALGFDFLAMPWNPWITVLPYGLLVMLTWSMACGDRWALPLAALVATFVIQTHVGYVILALPLAGFGALWLLVGAARASVRPGRRRVAVPADDEPAVGAGDESAAGNGVGEGSSGHARAEEEAAEDRPDDDGPDVEGADDGADVEGADDGADDGAREPTEEASATRRRGWVVPVLVAVGIVVVAWLPPVLQQLTHEPGNLAVTLRWFRERSDEGSTLRDGWRIVSAQYGLWPEWVKGRGLTNYAHEPLYVDRPIMPVLLAVVVLAGIAGWRRPGGDARRLVVVWLVASVLGVVAVARTIKPLYSYRLVWTWPLAAIASAYCLWVGWSWLAARVPRLERRALVPALALAVVVVTGIDVVGAARDGAPEADDSAVIGELGRQVADALPDDAGPLRVVPTSFFSIGYGNGLVAELDRRGFDGRWSLRHAWVEDHRDPPEHPWGILKVVTDGGLVTAWDDPELEMIAYVSDWTPDEVRERAARLERANAALAQADVPIEEMQRRFAEYAKILPPGSAAGVFLAPSTRTPPARAPNSGGS